MPNEPITAIHAEDLVALIRRLCRPLLPVPTNYPVKPPDRVFPVVIFDVYGTMLVSAAGDIGTDGGHDDEESFRLALMDGGVKTREIHIATNAVSCLREEIEKEHNVLYSRGVLSPEVDIVKIWARVARRLELPITDERQLRMIAVSYECRVNPVWPMPALEDTLNRLRDMGVVMGILSNAQFYTSYLFQALLDRDLAGLGFSPELCLWSYMEGEGKPSPRLFHTLHGRLAEKGITADNVLYVGNDILKDIMPAKHKGWKTALFAGDKRSVRLHRDKDKCRGIDPDYIMNDFRQLFGCSLD